MKLVVDKGGATFIPVRATISIILAIAIVTLAYVGLQNAMKEKEEGSVRRQCEELIALLSTMVKSGNARDVENPFDFTGDAREYNFTFPAHLVYIGFGVDPDPDNNGVLESGLTDEGNCIFYRVEGRSKQVIWLEESMKFREGKYENGRWTIREPEGYIIDGGGEITLIFELVEKNGEKYILIQAEDKYPYVDRIPPHVKITYPDREILIESSIIIKWEANDGEYGDVARIEIYSRRNENNEWQIEEIIYDPKDNTGEYEWIPPSPDKYYIKVVAVDEEGNEGIAISPPINYMFPFTVLRFEGPYFRENNTCWISSETSIYLDSAYGDTTYYRVWKEKEGWNGWMKGNSLQLSERGKYYIEYYSTYLGLNESSPNWKYVRNATIYVDDTSPITYLEISGPLATQVKTIHRPVDVVFLVDTSGSMNNEWNDLCNIIGDIVYGLEKEGIDFNYTIFGLGSAKDCAHNSWAVHSESWGVATAQAAAAYKWREGVVKIIIPVSDECPYKGGRTGNADDEAWIQEAIQKCKENNVIAYPMNGDGSSSDVIRYMDELASATGGKRFYWKSAEEVKNQLINIVIEVSSTEVIAGSSTSATTIWLNFTKDVYDVKGSIIYYRIKGPDGEWTEWMNSNPDENVKIRIFKEGSYTIQFYGKDNLGRVEEVHEKSYFVDSTPPHSFIFPASANLEEGDSILITATAEDKSNEGIEGIGVEKVALYYRVNGGEWIFYEWCEEEPYQWNFIASCSAYYEFKSVAVDLVGNREEI